MVQQRNVEAEDGNRDFHFRNLSTSGVCEGVSFGESLSCVVPTWPKASQNPVAVPLLPRKMISLCPVTAPARACRPIDIALSGAV